MAKVTLNGGLRFKGKAYKAGKSVEVPSDALKAAKASGLLVDPKANKSKGDAPENK